MYVPNRATAHRTVTFRDETNRIAPHRTVIMSKNNRSRCGTVNIPEKMYIIDEATKQ